jgi:hypothetical protein
MAPHPIMFNDDDPILARLRDVALRFPDASEKISHGRPAFCAPKMFAMYGGSIKVRPGEHVQHPHSMLIKVDDSERSALESDSRFFRPAYLGPSGWLGLDLDDPGVDWTEVGELLDASFRLTASPKSIRKLDET